METQEVRKLADEKKTEPGKEDGSTDEEKSSSDMIDLANEAADRLEEANRQSEELLQRTEALQVKQRLGGNAEAGIPPAKPVEETNIEYKNRIMKEGVQDVRPKT